MSVNDLQERLKRMQGAFEEAPLGGSSEMPPDGDYQGLVHGFDTFEQKAPPGYLFLKTELQVALDPDWTGKVVETIHNIEDPDRIGYAKAHLATLGIDVEQLDFSTLLEECEKVLDVPVAFTIKRSDKINEKTGQPYVNVYVNQRLGNPMSKPVADTTVADVPADTTDLDQPAPSQGEQDKIPFLWLPDDRERATNYNPFA